MEGLTFDTTKSLEPWLKFSGDQVAVTLASNIPQGQQASDQRPTDLQLRVSYMAAHKCSSISRASTIAYSCAVAMKAIVALARSCRSNCACSGLNLDLGRREEALFCGWSCAMPAACPQVRQWLLCAVHGVLLRDCLHAEREACGTAPDASQKACRCARSRRTSQ